MPFLLLSIVHFEQLACVVYQWRVGFISVKLSYISSSNVVTVVVIF